MTQRQRLILFHLTAITAILLCFAGSACLAQRDRGRPSPAPTTGGNANDRTELRRRRFEGIISNSATSAISPFQMTDVSLPRKGPLDINTLKYVLIEPKSRAITFVGTYDPAYATGPIPYADILKDALDNPYPSFSIEPTEQQKSQFEQVDRMITDDIGRMHDLSYCNQYAQKLLNLLLYDTSLAADSKRFFANCAAAMGMNGDELKSIYEAAYGKKQMDPSQAFQLMAKLMRGIGAPGAADGLLALVGGGSPEEVLGRMSTSMGLTSQFGELEKQRDSGAISADAFRKEAIILCISQLCREFEAPESGITSVVSSIRSGQQPADAIIDYMSEQMSNFIANRAGMRMLDGLVFGPELMAKLYNLPVPQSNMVFRNVASDSMLGDILFKADYRLKSVCTFPDARDKVADHLTDLQFMQKEAMARNYDLPAGVGADLGHRLVPGEVKMRVSPSGDVVEFQGAQVKVVGWVRGMLGNRNNPAAQFIGEMTPKYADFLTQRFDEYSKVYPEWHRMSEVAKVVALARWAKKNNCTIKVENASGVKVSHPASLPGFWCAVFQTSGDTPSMSIVAHGGASFSSDEGEDWVKTQPDVEVTSDVSKQLVASTVFAEMAANTALSGDLEAARDLADKSARAMSGEIDYTKLPSLDGIPTPGEPASYAAASAEVIDEASECLEQMDAAQKDLARAGQLAATSPDEAKKLTEQATRAQDEAQAKLKQLLSSVSTYKSDPSQAGSVVVALRGSSGVVTPGGTSTSSGGTAAQSTAVGTTTGPAKPEDWSQRCSEWIAELDEVNRKIASTRDMLLKLNASIQSDSKQFEEWEKAAGDGFDRCVGMATDWAIDFSAGALSDRYDTIYELAKKLPGKPEDVIEKYRYLASLAKRLKEAKAANDLDGLAKRENKTDTEIYETIRDGIGQISGLLGLDKTVPGMVWKYGSLTCDMAYNLLELRYGWGNVTTLEGNNDRYAEAVKKLAARMQELIERQKKLRQKIEAGEPVDYSQP